GRAVDQGGQAGRKDDSPLLPSVPLKSGAAGIEPAGLQPGEFVAAADFAQANRKLGADQLATATGEDRRAAGQTCSLLLAFAGGRTSDAAAVRGDAGPDRAATDTDGIASWWPSQSRKICLQQVGARRGVAKVCRKWAISGCAGGGRHTVGSAPDDKSFHSVANRRDECTMVPFLRPKRKFRFTRSSKEICSPIALLPGQYWRARTVSTMATRSVP